MKKGVAGLLILLAAGCGASQGDVSGKVKFKGVPLTEGTVMFYVNEKMYKGEIQPDGSYQIDHIPTGPAKIAVYVRQQTKVVVPNNPKVKVNVPNDIPAEARKAYEGLRGSKQEAKGPPPVAIPDRYIDQNKSGLTHEVKAGAQMKDLDLLE
jgi:hypothetical protein